MNFDLVLFSEPLVIRGLLSQNVRVIVLLGDEMLGHSHLIEEIIVTADELRLWIALRFFCGGRSCDINNLFGKGLLVDNREVCTLLLLIVIEQLWSGLRTHAAGLDTFTCALDQGREQRRVLCLVKQSEVHGV